ncbi:MAG: DUF2752 domain-containing protein [Clostridia bacterium]|nr:DUF2752 domain-containing protein [Clostridia bacterium]
MENKKIQRIILIAIASVFAIAIFKYKIGIPCIFNKITGFYCAGCGITRAIYSLIKLDFYQAFRYNMLVIILLPFGLVYLVYKYLLKGKKEIPNIIWYFLVGLSILFAILRNIPYFNYLAPTNI